MSKKVPVPGVAYSNQEFSGVLEVEVPENATDEDVQQRFQELYALLGQTVEAEIAAASEAARQTADAPTHDGQHDDARSGRDDGRDWRDNPRDGGDDRRDSRRDNHRNDRRDRDNYRDENRGRQDRRDDGGRGNGSRQGGGWRSGNGGNGGRGGQATNAQIKAIFGIAKSEGIGRRDLMERVEDLYHVRRVEELTVREASAFIESLKAA